MNTYLEVKTCTVSPPSAFLHSFLHFLPMQSILQMNLEIVNACFRSRRVHLARAILASDTGVVHVFDALLQRIFVERDRLIGGNVDGCVTHQTFKLVVRVALLEAMERLGKPWWWGRLSKRCY